MMSSARFAAAYAIDWVVGDPPGLPHPVRLIGSAISAGERSIRRPGSPSNELLRGAALAAAIVGGAWFVARLAVQTGRLAEILLAWTTLATRSLLDQSASVLEALDRDDPAAARTRLRARVISVVNDLLRRHAGQSIALVTHGGVI